MYVFAIALMLGLGAFALAACAERYVSMLRELWAVTLVVMGVALAWLVDFDVFRLWGMDTRADWIGVTLTGLMIGGLAFAVRGGAALVSALTRKVGDEAETIEKEKNLRRVA